MRLLGLLAILVWLCLTTHADARTVTGWKRGQRTRIKLVAVGGVELESRTAAAFRKMADAALEAGIELVIRSGFRSHEQQQLLYDRFRAGSGNLAARPGYSNHQNGKAVDIYLEDGTYEWLRKNAHRFGFKQTVKREAWHWEYVGRAKARPRARGRTGKRR